MPNVVLGNIAPIEPRKLDERYDAVERIPRPDLGWVETIWVIPSDESLTNAIRSVTSAWESHHSDDAPAWVESDDPLLAEALHREFGCSVGRPDNWEDLKAASKEVLNADE